MQTAFRWGLKPAEFWSLTPYECWTYCHARAKAETEAYRVQLFGAWHSAGFARQKRLPPLSKVLSFDAGKQPTVKELRGKVKMMHRIFGGTWRNG